jgi:multicomponent Na+:H+ antiporter subunit D
MLTASGAGNMSQQLPAFIVVLPLVVSFLVFFSGWWLKRAGYPLVMATLACCFLAALAILKSVIVGGHIQYRLGGWAPPWGIEYAVDHLNALMLVLVTFLSTLTAWHGRTAVEAEMPQKTSLFWTLYLLLVTGLLGIVITSDVFNLFVLLEVTSLSGYTLIALGRKRATYASLRYVYIGTIGASFYLLGVGYLYISTGSLNMSDLSQLLPKLYHSKAVIAGFAFITIGLSIKMALFPMHSWLPDAYTYAPDPVSTAVAPLMTKVMAYVIMRLMFTVFGVEFSISVIRVSDVLVWFGTFAILFGAVMALSQDDYKRMLSFIIVAEMGYIVGGIGVANANALKGAVFHIVNDAVMVACLFMVAGMVVNKTGGHRIEDFKGLFRSMPITASIFTVGALAVVGVPPTCGFFSKWYLVLGGIEARQWGFVAALLLCTLINVALFFRIFDRGLYVLAPDDGPHARSASTASPSGDAPLSMVLPASVLAIAIVLIGIFNQAIVDTVIRFAIPKGL